MLENQNPSLSINDPIAYEETDKVVTKAKNATGVGVDYLPYECMKNEKSKRILTQLFEKIFRTCIAPNIFSNNCVKILFDF